MIEIIIVAIIIFVFVRKYSASLKRFSNNRPGQERPSAQVPEITVKKPVHSTLHKNMRLESDSTLMDDREHDWLARQREEESRSLRLVSEMFELKSEHAKSCDAEMLRRFHEERHGTQ